MKSFIRVAEVWVPSADDRVLELAAGLFDAAPDFGTISRTICFGRSEGLPGHAWHQGRPILLARFEGSFFRRTAAAYAADLTCAVALPIFVRGRLTSVVVLLCGDVNARVGALELWRHDPAPGADLLLDQGYYGSSDLWRENFERDRSLSRKAGAHAARLAWQQDAPSFVPIDAESSFDAPGTIGHALALPCRALDGAPWVLSLVSTDTVPVARRIENWSRQADGTLRRTLGHGEVRGDLSAADATAATLAPDDPGAIARACRSGVAQARNSADGETSDAVTGRALRESGLRSVLAIPTLAGDEVTGVVALYL